MIVHFAVSARSTMASLRKYYQVAQLQVQYTVLLVKPKVDMWKEQLEEQRQDAL